MGSDLKTVLLVDDELAHVELIVRAFEDQAPHVTLHTAHSLAEARAKIEQNTLDLVILDFLLPDGKGVELLPGEDEKPSFPIVMMTSHGNEQLAVEAMKAGALDYVVKSGETLANMPYIVERSLREWGHVQSRHRAESVLRESEIRLRSVLDASMDPIICADGKGIVTLVSGSVDRVFGWKPEEVIGQSLRLFMSESAKADFAEFVGTFRDADKVPVGNTREYEAVRKDGSVFPCEVSVSSVQLPEYGETLFASTVRDITERKKAEAERRAMESQMRQQQRLESIGTLASGVAHEISNPIQGIMNYAELLKDSKEEISVTDFANEIIHESDRIATIVRNLLSFARVGGEERQRVHVSDILDATLALIHSLLTKDQISLRIEIPEELPLLECNSQQIQQVFMNLVTNARDALNTRYEKYDTNKLINVTADSFSQKGEPWVRITVEDHGSGITPSAIEYIFDPFFTTKGSDQGTGLGLALSYGIISEHGGELSVESEPGNWTRFHIELPAAKETD
jgi:PAS domain S-box-containing protein